MVSFFNREIRQAFIQQEIQRPYYSFSKEGDYAYTMTYKYLKDQYSDPGNGSIDHLPTKLTNIYDPIESAREFACLLPTHTLKMYDTFLRMENEAQEKGQYLFLDAPFINLVDVGCGGGSASIALLMLIANYQKFRRIKGLPVYPIDIRLLGIDPNVYVLRIFEKFLPEMQKQILDFNINITYDEICGKLSEHSDRMCQWLRSAEDVHICYFVFGNVIRPQKDDFCKPNNISIINKLSNLFYRPRQIEFIGETDIDSIIMSLDEHLSDKVGLIVVSSSSSDENKKSKNWFDETQQFFESSCKKIQLSNHDIELLEKVKRRTISILATSSGFYRNVRKYFDPIATVYNVGFAIFKAKRYVEIQPDWENVIKTDNLMLAWARVRNDQAFANLEDTLEFRFFETNIKDRIEQLHCRLLFYDWQVLGTENPMHFKVLKGENKEPRPMSVCRIEEQIVATAFLQSKATEYNNICKNFFAYQISPEKKGENFYHCWFTAHNNFINAARGAAIENPTYFVIKTDLSSFYTSIDQNLLCQQLCNLFSGGNLRIQKLIKWLVIRDCGINQPGKGIVQGHIISGAFSNIYLLPVDRSLLEYKDRGISIFRYVDDMVLIYPPRFQPEDVITILKEQLTKLGLTLSSDKTSLLSCDDFLYITAPDIQLEKLSKEFNNLMTKVYKLPRSYFNLVESNKWEFLRTYQKALSKVGCYISVARLTRKITKYRKWWEHLMSFQDINFPDINDLDDLSSEEWKNQFEKINRDSPNAWIEKRIKLQEELIIMFNENYQILIGNDHSNEKEMIIAKRRFKASVNRLGKLGFGSTQETIVDILIHKPWLLNVRRVCEDLALQNEKQSLLTIIQSVSDFGTDYEYVRSCVYKAFAYLPHLGFKDKKFIEIIKKPTFSLADEATVSEKTMSSEALFLTRNTPKMSKVRLQNVFDSDCLPAQKRNMSLLFNTNYMNGHPVQLVKQKDYSTLEVSQYENIGFDPDILYSEEPDILSDYYESNYPDNDLEFPEKPSWV